MKKIMMALWTVVLLIALGIVAGCFKAEEIVKSSARQYATPPIVAAPMMQHAVGAAVTPRFNTERYDVVAENQFLDVLKNPLSTFSADVDTASYSNIRRHLNQGVNPPVDLVRIEEMINYFSYSYPGPTGDVPFAFTTELTDCPWNKENKLLLIGMQGKEVSVKDLPPANLVFLIDVSGSMSDELPRLVTSFKMLVTQLRPQDKVSIVVYAGRSGLVLPPASGDNKAAIVKALDSLEASGSTAGGQGIQLAYKVARENFVTGGNNRVILATDGDFNVGVSSDAELVRLIEEKRKDGVFLSVLGFGYGNLNDSMMRKLANSGNGNYNYIDSLMEAKKVLIRQYGGTLMTIAKDLKLQVEFNPAKVQSYRLIGYEKRVMRAEDFKDDKKDAGDIGAGHTVTALYEIVPATQVTKKTEELTYQSTSVKESAAAHAELATIRFRYKKPDQETSLELKNTIPATVTDFKAASENIRFAAAVAGWGMLLKNSEFKGTVSYTQLLEMAVGAKGVDAEGHRAEFIKLLELSCVLTGGTCAQPGARPSAR